MTSSVCLLKASVYKIDFEAERKSREELNDDRLKLQEKLLVTEEELQALKVANQIPVHSHYTYAPPPARRTVGVMEEIPAGDNRQWRIAQEHSATQGATVAVPVVTAVETQPPTNRTNTEVSHNFTSFCFYSLAFIFSPYPLTARFFILALLLSLSLVSYFSLAPFARLNWQFSVSFRAHVKSSLSYRIVS